MKKELISDRFISKSEFEAMKPDEQTKNLKIVLSDDVYLYGDKLDKLISSIDGLTSVLRDKR